jgi:hypothetical protein
MALLESFVLVYIADKATGGYHGQMNSDNFEEWVTEKVISTSATPSAIVSDTSPWIDLRSRSKWKFLVGARRIKRLRIHREFWAAS